MSQQPSPSALRNHMTLFSLLLPFFLLQTNLSSVSATPTNQHSFVRQLGPTPTVCPVVLRHNPPTDPSDLPSNDAPINTLPLRPRAGTRSATRVDPRIVNGQFASRSLQSSMAVVFNGRGHCSGSVLSSTWVLTAAHCRTDEDTVVIVGTSQFLVGRTRIGWRDGTAIGVAESFQNPQFARNLRGLRFDIALLRLQQPVPDGTPFFHINVNPDDPESGVFGRTMGYGATIFEEPEPTDDRFRLRQLDLPVVDPIQCARLFRSSVSPMYQVCAGYTGGTCSPCQGDSGGPIFQYTSAGTPVQFGIVSFGSGCSTETLPAVYTRVSAHVPWMRSVGAQFTPVRMSQSVFTRNDPGGANDTTPLPPPDVFPNTTNADTDTSSGPFGADSSGNGDDDDRGGNVLLIIGAAVGIVALSVTLAVAVVFVMRRKHANDRADRSDESNVPRREGDSFEMPLDEDPMPSPSSEEALVRDGTSPPAADGDGIVAGPARAVTLGGDEAH